MGVGLTVADRLAKKNNGSIRINSLTGQGTVARITLPAGAVRTVSGAGPAMPTDGSAAPVERLAQLSRHTR